MHEVASLRRVSDCVELLDAAFERHVYDRHIHDTCALGFTLRGVQRFWCRGATRDSTPGDAILIAPGEVHDGESGAPGGYAYRMMYVSIERIERVLADVGEQRVESIGSRVPVIADARLLRRLKATWRALNVSPGSLAADELLDGTLQALVARDALQRKARRVVTDDKVLRRVREYLHEHADQRVSLQDLATLASMSRFQLTRKFQRTFGLPLHAYHLHVRLEEAKRRIARNDSISAVAVDLGFADQSHLHRRFKRVFGVTPGQWRKAVA